MAAQSPLHPQDQHTAASVDEIFRAFMTASDSILLQIAAGSVRPVIRLSALKTLSPAGIETFRMHIEMCTATSYQLWIDSQADRIILVPINALETSLPAPSVNWMAPGAPSQLPPVTFSEIPPSRTEFFPFAPPQTDQTPQTVQMPSVAAPAQAVRDTRSDEASTYPAGPKVPRPANSFILYRQDWHPKIVAEQPHLSNNEISKIIGKKWSEESQSVKDDYKRKASDLKAKHAIEHPDYRYTPRKPSEKKRRMSKTKVAKLRSQVNRPDATKHSVPLQSTASDAQNVQALAQSAAPKTEADDGANDHASLDNETDQEQSFLAQSLIGFNTAFDAASPATASAGPVTASSPSESEVEAEANTDDVFATPATEQDIDFSNLDEAFPDLEFEFISEMDRQGVLDSDWQSFQLDDLLNF